MIPPLVTRGDRHLEDLKRWYAEGKLSWDGFVSGVDLNLREQAKGWAQDLVRSSEAYRSSDLQPFPSVAPGDEADAPEPIAYQPVIPLAEPVGPDLDVVGHR